MSGVRVAGAARGPLCRLLPFAAGAAAFCCLTLLPGAAASRFRVSPMRIDLNGGSASVTLKNIGDEPISFQVSAVSWEQDASGRDVYAETGDLVYFPRLMTVERGDSQVIRVGVKGSAGLREKTYRIYVEELKAPRPGDATQIAIKVRMGLPVFVRPAACTTGGEFVQPLVSAGTFRVLLRNTGNCHFKLESLRVRGTDRAGSELFSKDLEGWYLLGGASRRFEAEIPEEICPGLATVRITAKAGPMIFEGEAAVETGSCRR